MRSPLYPVANKQYAGSIPIEDGLEVQEVNPGEVMKFATHLMKCMEQLANLTWSQTHLVNLRRTDLPAFC